MDERFYQLYENELFYIQEKAREFALAYPRTAERLDLQSGHFPCADPFVERLLEGFAFLAARVQMKLVEEFPRFTENLLEAVIPHYLAPVPSAAIVQLVPNRGLPAMAAGHRVVRGSRLLSRPLGVQEKRCQFNTVHDVVCFPMEVTAAEYLSQDLGALKLPPRVTEKPPRSAVRVTIGLTAVVPAGQFDVDELTFFLGAREAVGGRLYEQLVARTLGVFVRGPGIAGDVFIPPQSVTPAGFERDEAILPYDDRSYQGFRLLQEYFLLPQRYLFVTVRGLRQALARLKGDHFELVFLLDRDDDILEQRVNAQDLALFCTPVVNLFERTADRIRLTDRLNEMPVVVDRMNPGDHEVYRVDEVVGYGEGAGERTVFRPFFQTNHASTGPGAYFAVHREAGRAPAPGRNSRRYIGSDVFLSLVDGRELPYRSNLRELDVSVLCTNRDLSCELAVPPVLVGSADAALAADFFLEDGPVGSVRTLVRPTFPRPSFSYGERAWRLIKHLGLNYIGLSAAGGDVRRAIEELLTLYADPDSRVSAQQISGIRGVRVKPVVSSVACPGAISFARGTEVEVELQERAFPGGGAFVLGSVLDHFLAGYVSINSFTRTRLRTDERGEIHTCNARPGRRPTL